MSLRQTAKMALYFAAAVMLFPIILSACNFGANRPPVANAGPDQTVPVSTTVTLNGNGSSDPDGNTLMYRWVFTAKPDNSVANLQGATTVQASFYADVAGIFTVRLMVNDGTVDSAPDTVNITVVGSGTPIPSPTPTPGVTPAPSPTPTPGVTPSLSPSPSPVATPTPVGSSRPLGFHVVDAEYSRQRDRIIIVASEPYRGSNNYWLHIYDPATGNDTPVKLDMHPNCVSVSPDGLYAAVGHDGGITLVDLVAGSVLQDHLTLNPSVNVVDIVLAGTMGNHYAYVLTDLSNEPIHCIDLTTGIDTPGTGPDLPANCSGTLYGNTLYVPLDKTMQRYDITGGTAAYIDTITPIYGVGGKIWVSLDGAFLFKKNGKICSSDGIHHSAWHPSLTVQSASHSLSADRVAIVPILSDTEVWTYDYTNHDGETWANLSSDDAVHGKFVFFDNAGTNYYVLAQGDDQSWVVVAFTI
ncbi:MAG: PKD domain-containing protein [Bacteroidota bacterium]